MFRRLRKCKNCVSSTQVVCLSDTFINDLEAKVEMLKKEAEEIKLGLNECKMLLEKEKANEQSQTIANMKSVISHKEELIQELYGRLNKNKNERTSKNSRRAKSAEGKIQ